MRELPAPTEQDQLDAWGTLARKTLRHARSAAIFAVVGVVLVVAIAMVRQRRYRSETVVLYREGVRWSYLGASDLVDPGRRVGQRLRDLVMSRVVLQQVMDEHHLYPVIADEQGKNEAIEQFRRDITFRVGDGDTVSIGYESESPDTAQAVAAAIAGQLVTQSLRLRQEQTALTSDFLDAEARRSEDALRAKETELARFLAEHPEFAQETQVPGSPGASRARPGAATEKPTGLAALDREAARIRMRLSPSTNAPPAAPVAAPAVQIDPKLAADKRAADAELASATRDLQDKESKYTPQHPDVRAAQARVKAAQAHTAQIDSDLRAHRTVEQDAPAVAAPAPATTEDRRALESRLSAIEAAIARAKAITKDKTDDTAGQDDTTKAIVALETDWQRLSREVTEAREHHKQIQDKTFLASVAASSASQGSAGQMLVIDPAYKPLRPIGFGRTRLVLVGLAFVVPLALALALILALLDDHVYRKADVERLASVPVIGVVPKRRLSRG